MKKEKSKKFKFLPHTADIKFQAFGENLEEVFSNSALAVFHSMSDDRINSSKRIKISVKGKDLENLLYNFLEELIFLLDSKSFFLSSVNSLKITDNLGNNVKIPPKFSVSKISRTPNTINEIMDDKNNLSLKAELFGDDAANYEIHLDVKAVTYSDMFVRCQNNLWTSQVVLDV